MLLPRHWFPIASTLELDPKRPTPVRLDGLDLVVWQAGRLKEFLEFWRQLLASILASEWLLFVFLSDRRHSMCSVFATGLSHRSCMSKWSLSNSLDCNQVWAFKLCSGQLKPHGDSSSHCRFRDRKMQKTADGECLATFTQKLLISFFL